MGIKGTLSNGLKGLGKVRINLNHATILTYAALLLILFIAFTIRVLPIRWEIPSGTLGLNEFDPYYQYSLTNHMVTNGLLSPYTDNNGVGWINTRQFYPEGLNMGLSLPSLPMTAAIAYDIVSALGININLMSFCSLMAPFLGTLAVFAMYFIGKDLAGKTAGLLSALILSLMPSLIQRSSLGFFDTETVGILSLLLFIFFFLRALDQKRSLRSTIIYSIFAAGAIAYFSAGWGGAYFAIDLAALFAVVMVLIKRYSQRLLLSFSITFGLGLFISISVPFLSPRYMLTAAVLPVAGVFLLLCVAEVWRAQISARTKTILAAAFLVVLVGGVIAVSTLGDVTGIAGKFFSVLDPYTRANQPLIASVAEHKITAWGSMYYELGIGILFFLMGLYFCLKNPTTKNVFFILFGITTLYFASSMARLLVLLAPAYALLVTVGVLGLLKPFNTLLREAATKTVLKTKRALRKVGKEYSVLAIGIVFLLLVTNFAFSPQNKNDQPRVYDSAYSPIAISSASLPLPAPNGPIPTWLNMLAYTRNNLTPDTVVSSWWDYGNWLGYLGNVTTLADNTTVNATQIENIGFSLMANETQSLKMLQNYDAEYVVVFVTLQLSQSSTDTQTVVVKFAGFGDEGKWFWMARISGEARDRLKIQGYMTPEMTWQNETDFGYNATSGQTEWNTLGQSSTIYKMMTWAMQSYATKYGLQSEITAAQPEYFLGDGQGGYFSGLEVEPQTAANQYQGLIPLVCLYKIDWDKYQSFTNSSATP